MHPNQNKQAIINYRDVSNQDNNIDHIVNTHSGTFNQTLFKIIPIKIYCNNDSVIETFAFIDEG